jgi:hypothetical protein
MFNETHWEGSRKYKLKQGLFQGGAMTHPHLEGKWTSYEYE